MNKIEELLKLKELLDSGLINESDFTRKKDELFNNRVEDISKPDIHISSKGIIENKEIISQPFIPKNDNKYYYVATAVIIILIVGVIFLNRNTDNQTPIKNDDKIMEVKLPPKENLAPEVRLPPKEETNNNVSPSDTLQVVQSSNNIIRDPRAKDFANVYFNSNYTLFDLETDEPIYPDQNGIYEIWYSSNENPVSNSRRLSIKELESFTFYKFKNQVNCEEWCRKKQQRN